jgi:hypothetical protein
MKAVKAMYRRETILARNISIFEVTLGMSFPEIAAANRDLHEAPHRI